MRVRAIIIKDYLFIDDGGGMQQTPYMRRPPGDLEALAHIRYGVEVVPPPPPIATGRRP